MKSQTNNYDAVSRYYDRLGSLVFGGALMRSQSYFLPMIPAGSRVLIVGGGTGKILERLARVHPQRLQVVYVELSEKMLELSQRRNVGNHTVEFVHSGVEDFRNEILFDAIITPFLFDNFLLEKAGSIHAKMNGMLRPAGYWLYTDFVPHATGWKNGLLQSMYFFFKTVAQVEARQLPDMASVFATDYQVLDSKTFYAGLMESVVYQKK